MKCPFDWAVDIFCRFKVRFSFLHQVKDRISRTCHLSTFHRESDHIFVHELVPVLLTLQGLFLLTFLFSVHFVLDE
jgi:hypothetical protein